jgi:flagellar motor switch protein FliM
MTDAAFAEPIDPLGEEDEDRASGLSERVLNQAEIDSLLGFDLGR